MEKGSAYNVEGNVFYEVSKFEITENSAEKILTNLESGSRVEINEEKTTRLILRYGKKQKKENLSGKVHGGKEGRDGILNALQ